MSTVSISIASHCRTQQAAAHWQCGQGTQKPAQQFQLTPRIRAAPQQPGPTAAARLCQGNNEADERACMASTALCRHHITEVTSSRVAAAPALPPTLLTRSGHRPEHTEKPQADHCSQIPACSLEQNPTLCLRTNILP